MVKRWYFAAQFARREEVRIYAERTRAAGLTITSRWLVEPPDDMCTAAAIDLADIDAADGLLLFTENPAVGIVRGSRHVEYGYALCGGKVLEIVGPRESIFNYLLSDSTVFATFDAWLEAHQ